MVDPAKATIRNRLASVRDELRREHAHALLVPSSDPHLSEYLPARWKGREWLSGFIGSMGTLVVALDAAAVFADTRYWEIGETALGGTGIDLVKIVRAPEPAYREWLMAQLTTADTVMVDAASMGIGNARALRDQLAGAGMNLRTDLDLLDRVWVDRPPVPIGPIYAHLPPYCVRKRSDNLAHVRAAMRDAGATHHFISSLDDIAWMTNLRGDDIPFNPMFLSHFLIDHDTATLFVTPGKLNATIEDDLASDGITCADYGQMAATLATLPTDCCVLLDPDRVTLGVVEALPASVTIVEAINPSTIAKSIKLPAEVDGFRQTAIEEGAAMCRFYAAFEKTRAAGQRWTEDMVHIGLTAERARGATFVSPSFETCTAFNANGPLLHYCPVPGQAAVIKGDGLLLVDTGGQYLGGTTDTARVWAIGTPTEAMRQDVTTTLKALIAISNARFPVGTSAPALDALARAPGWAQGTVYRHGTGHGVGHFLSCHEAPFYFNGPAHPWTVLKPGAVLAVEPGVYRAGQWGARFENEIVTVDAGTSDQGEFLAFETLTLCPIDTRCLLPDQLDPSELAWLNEYHSTVRERLLPHVDGDAHAWLIERTARIAGLNHPAQRATPPSQIDKLQPA